MSRSSLMATAGLLLALPVGAHAQSASAVCEQVGQLEPGQWAEFQTRAAADTAPHVETMRFALLGSEQVPEGDRVWYEFRADTREGRMIIQFLVPGFPFQGDDIEAMVMKAGQEPAMRLPDQMLQSLKQQVQENPILDFAKQCEQAEIAGTENVEVPAGTFDATHITGLADGGEAWISEEVPFGIVKGKLSDGSTMVLTGSGTGAESSITETPVEMPFPGGGGL